MAERGPVVGVKAACAARGQPRAPHYRRMRPPAPRPGPPRPPPPRALRVDERHRVRTGLRSEPSVDAAPPTGYATGLDQGTALASGPTLDRLLRSVDAVRERRRPAVHPARVKPEVVAARPNRVWFWDIAKLRGPAQWTSDYLYVVIDISSRSVLGWRVATRESASLAERLLAAAVRQPSVDRDPLPIHANRGSSRGSKPVALLLADLGVTTSHSRPRCSNDHPYREAQFQTLTYRPDFPDRCGSVQHARGRRQPFFRGDHPEPRHAGIGDHTPWDVHRGGAQGVRDRRAAVLTGASATHPERFVRKPPEPPRRPGPAWIHRPAPEMTTAQ